VEIKNWEAFIGTLQGCALAAAFCKGRA